MNAERTGPVITEEDARAAEHAEARPPEAAAPEPTPPAPEVVEEAPPKRLYRSRRERMIFGVCGGLAQYFDVDPTLVRLAFVVLALGTGIGFLAYLILAIVMPERPAEQPEPPITGSLGADRSRALIGWILLAFGLLLLLSNLRLFAPYFWEQFGSLFWPLVLVAAGVAVLLWRRSQG